MKPELHTFTVISTAKRWLRLKGFRTKTLTDSRSRVILGEETGAEGCFRAHLKAMEEAVFEGADYLVVFEDDARPTSTRETNSDSWLSELEHLHWTFIHLGSKKEAQQANPVRVQGTHWFLYEGGNPPRSYAYIASSEFMSSFLNRTHTEQHIDDAISAHLDERGEGMHVPAKAIYLENRSLPQDIPDRDFEKFSN